MNSVACPAVFAPLRVRAPRATARSTPVTCSARKAPVARAARTTKPAVSEEVREGLSQGLCMWGAFGHLGLAFLLRPRRQRRIYNRNCTQHATARR